MTVNSPQKGFVPIIIFIVVALVIGGYLISQKINFFSSQPFSSPIPNELSQCIKQKQKEIGKSHQYQEGVLLVGYKSISEEEAQNIIKSYGLDFDKNYKISITPLLKVYVPQGSELKWWCELKNNPHLQPELNSILRIN
ncbi:hypothetical protein HY404_02035 [Candidatus Microgenomates bacterium]|nr:hypothetical protein [Candidatus Microgenomates bacterium]